MTRAVVTRSAQDESFYDGLSRLTEGSVESVFARGSASTIVRGDAVGARARATGGSSVRVVRGNRVKEAARLLLIRVLFVLLAIPFIVGCLAIGWFL